MRLLRDEIDDENILARMQARLEAMPEPTAEERAAEDAAKEAKRIADARSARAKAMERAGWDARPIALAQSDGYDENAPAASTYLVALRSFDNSEGGVVVLAGPPGSGKTAAAARWSHTRTNGPPRFVRSAEFFRSSRYDDKRELFLAAFALVFDDAGAEYADPNGSFRVDFDELVDRFYADKRILVITTNMDAKAFGERFGARVTDRLRECGRWVSSNAPSMRRRVA